MIKLRLCEKIYIERAYDVENKDICHLSLQKGNRQLYQVPYQQQYIYHRSLFQQLLPQSTHHHMLLLH